ncbi:hypothetical protein NMY3_03036 [Candidatus Nitrosocosmicus oleophilus]|uniref:Uncharacterized protein n=1 Tax=Candidatus Nitrosocosmicus oleophilus TaxID=1353260 RepID=A0A654M3G6_9ARCH|nr:hypothetical protein [Candidatus Nitrosocosmicus oleophilus]ALI37223.1 hypothetical protein NMY3_03036 [Candidatus Nitrosocosmicus oleophilus]
MLLLITLAAYIPHPIPPISDPTGPVEGYGAALVTHSTNWPRSSPRLSLP